MLSKAALIATATAIASIKGVAAKHKDSSGLSGVGYDACHINPEATAVINGGTCDARNIAARDDGAYPLEGAYGLFVDTDATATVCNANLIKGGTQIVDGNHYGRGAVYVASGATLNIVDGLIEGGNTNEEQSGSYGIYASYETNEHPNNVVITGGQILGGNLEPFDAINGKSHERGAPIATEAGGNVDVYGGVIGDKSSLYSLALFTGASGVLPTSNNVSTVNIYGGRWGGTAIWVYVRNNGMAYLNIYGENLEEKPAPNDEVLVEGLCDGSKFEQTIALSYYDDGYAEMNLINDCSSVVVPTFFDVCGSGKTKRSRRL